MMIGMPTVIIGVILFAYLGDVVMLVLGGEEFVPGSYVIPLVAPILLFSFPAVMLGFPVLGAVGHIKQLTASSVTASLFQITGLCVLAIAGIFSIETVAFLRCSCEAVLMSVRVFFVWRFWQEEKAKQLSQPSNQTEEQNLEQTPELLHNHNQDASQERR